MSGWSNYPGPMNYDSPEIDIREASVTNPDPRPTETGTWHTCTGYGDGSTGSYPCQTCYPDGN